MKVPKLKPDFSSQAYDLKNSKIIFDKNKLEKLKVNYGFKSDFNLEHELNEAYTWTDLFKDLDNQAPRLSKKKKILVEAEELSGNLINCFKRCGAKITRDIIKAIEKSYIPSRGGELLSNFLQTLDAVHNALLLEISMTPKDNTGRSKSLARKRMIVKLAEIYEKGTGIQPKAYKDEYAKRGYGGKFYNFLCDCRKKLALGTPDSIAKAAMEVLPKYKEARKHEQQADSFNDI